MKIIKINIPTSLADIKDIWKNRTSARYTHNRAVLSGFYFDCCKEIASGYWKNDISKDMIKALTDSTNGKFSRFFSEAVRKLK